MGGYDECRRHLGRADCLSLKRFHKERLGARDWVLQRALLALCPVLHPVSFPALAQLGQTCLWAPTPFLSRSLRPLVSQFYFFAGRHTGSREAMFPDAIGAIYDGSVPRPNADELRHQHAHSNTAARVVTREGGP